MVGLCCVLIMAALPASFGEHATIPSMQASDLGLTSGASFVTGPADAACSGMNIRSGDPGSTTRIQFDHPRARFTLATIAAAP